MKIEDKSIKELIEMLGFNLSYSDLQIIFRNNEEPLRAFDEEVSRLRKMESYRDISIGEGRQRKFNASNEAHVNGVALERILIKFEDRIDKKAFVLLSLYNSQNEIEKGELNERRQLLMKRIKKAIEIIGRDDFTIVVEEYQGKLEFNVRIINSTKLIQCIKSGKKLETLNKPSKKQIEHLMQVEDKIGIGRVVSVLPVEDIKQCANDRAIGNVIVDKIISKAIQQHLEAHPDVNINSIETSSRVRQQIGRDIDKNGDIRVSMIEVLGEDCNYIDFDKLLLISAYRHIDLLENLNGEEFGSREIVNGEIKEKNYQETIDMIGEILRTIQQLIAEKTEAEIEGVKYNLDYLTQDLKRFKEGRYIRKVESESAKERILGGETTLLDEDEQVLSTIELAEGNIETLIRNSEKNIIFLISHDVAGRDDIEDILYARGTCSTDLFIFINQREMLNCDQIIRMFEDGIINSEAISTIEDPEVLQSVNENTSRRIKELSISMLDKENKEPEKVMEQFNRYATLYKRLNIFDKGEENIANASFKLISSFEDDLTDEVLQRLYQFGIITLEAAADWGVNLNEMLSSNSIRPTDLKGLYAKQVISIDAIKEVLINGTLSYEEKLDLIYSTFDGESEEEQNYREELMQFLTISEQYKTEGEGRGQRTRRTGIGTKSKEFITEPHTRWKLISLLDRDYSKKFLPTGKEVMDGHRVFLLPNRDKIVIERMHEKRAGKDVKAYGSATYIMDTDEFFRDIDNIIIDGAINRRFLIEAAREEKATKLIHSKNWGEAVKKYFDITPENERYTDEEIKAINTAIENVRNSRRERD